MRAYPIATSAVRRIKSAAGAFLDGQSPYWLLILSECTDGLVALQTAYDDAKTKRETDKASANAKLQALGLTDDEIKAIKGIK